MIAVSAAIQGQHFRVAQPHLLTPGRVAPMIALRLSGKNPSLFATQSSKNRKVWLEPRSRPHLRHSRHSFGQKMRCTFSRKKKWSWSTWSKPLTCARHRAKSLSLSIQHDVDWAWMSLFGRSWNWSQRRHWPSWQNWGWANPCSESASYSCFRRQQICLG